MPDWKVLITDGLEETGQNILRQGAFVDDREGISAEELSRILAGYDALIVRGRTKVTAGLLENVSRLKVVGRAGVGVDNIDLAAAKAHDIAVVNAPVSTSLAVAELAIGLMFALARQLPFADRTMKDGEWAKKALQGIELNGKTLGVIGMGNIGSSVAVRASALGMTVLGYDPLIPVEEIARRSAQPVDIQELYVRSDFITIHIPLTVETTNMIDGLAFSWMKPGVRIVSTARGGIINEAALFEALEAGLVAGAALDVFAQEPPGKTALISHPSVIATPHMGAQTAEAQSRAAVDIAHEILAALRAEKLRWRVA